MKELGLGLLIIGLVSMLLPLINPNLKFMFLTWIDNWGTNIGWAIRGGFTLLGLVLWLGFRNRN